MKIIAILSESIDEEISDSEKYAKKALEHKNDYPETAKVFYTLSLEEMEHMNKLHGAIVFLIKKYREEKGEPPKEMLAVYEYLHKKQIDRVAEVKMLQSMFQLETN